jgi:hypothetical protein
MEDEVDVARDVDVVGDVGVHKLESPAAGQMFDVRRRTGEEVVDADHAVAVIEEALTDMRAQEPGAAGDHGSPRITHQP